jgi:hypothetical protein
MTITIIRFDEKGNMLKRVKQTQITHWRPCFDDITYMTSSKCVLSKDGNIIDFYMTLPFYVDRIYPFGMDTIDKVGDVPSVVKTNLGELFIQTDTEANRYYIQMTSSCTYPVNISITLD